MAYSTPSFKNTMRATGSIFFRFCRMSPESFDYVAYMIESRIKKKNTNFRKPISPEERLAVTLRYLALGETQQAIAGVQGRSPGEFSSFDDAWKMYFKGFTMTIIQNAELNFSKKSLGKVKIEKSCFEKIKKI